MNLKIVFASFTAALALMGSAAERNIPQGYYNELDGKKGAELKRAVYNAIKNHKEISYGDKTWNAFKTFEVTFFLKYASRGFQSPRYMPFTKN